ncbi:hypothetical protein FOA52_005907 [Chlamydomonas sp. UWO 241]|nr:hypothetical protein FOA52_005907 [Chlamydomonas sp. UWO 241]
MAEPATKKAKVEVVEGDGGGGEGDISDPAAAALAAVKQELDKLNEEASDKVLEIEQAYSRLRRPVYKKRAELLSKIPGFWGAAIARHPEFRGMLTPEDEDILSYCTQVEVEDYEDIKSGYKIMFSFREDNPYFSEGKLTKSFTYQQGGSLFIKCTRPTWSEGCEPIMDNVEEGGGASQYHFFSWFMDEEHEVMDTNDDIAELIKEEIWTDPMRYWAHEGPYTEEGEEGEEFSDGEGEEPSGEDEDGDDPEGDEEGEDGA